MARYLVGIDLGTSNTVVAYAEAGAAADGDPVRLLPIDQLVGLGEVAARPLLPSLRYHPAPGELRPEQIALPWSDPDEPLVIGTLARLLGAQVPGRLVASAKSWLSHGGVDRSAAILPWGGPDEVVKVSPLEASASYLATVHMAWNERFPDAPLDQQQVVLTVPASFDEGARALTLEAARMAGLPGVRLLEEPQAAFYDWLLRHRTGLAAELGDARLVLVCDVGGGTTDLTLIQVAPRDGVPEFTRIAVGRHLMVGGDNMDLALAHLAEARFGEGAERLSASRFSLLLDRSRVAKEQLLADDAPAHVKLTLPGAGSRLVAGARSLELDRDEVRSRLVDGFLPRVGWESELRQRRSGLVEFGLPYPADPAITRHLAAFLRLHAGASRQALGERAPAQGLPVPDAILLNGGVFRAAALADRLAEVLGEWRGAAPRVLINHDPDVAVARGAVAFALGPRGPAPRIGGGSARSYFIVVDSDDEDRKGICVLPRGSEEGREVMLDERRFALRLGEPVGFLVAATSADRAFGSGELATLGEDFDLLPPLAAVLPAPSGRARTEVQVRLGATMSEVGTLQVQCVDCDDVRRRWSLEFQMRSSHPPAPVAVQELPSRFGDALEMLDTIFGGRAQQSEASATRQVRARLEQLLGRREDWDLALLRALCDALLERARRRRRSAEHERLWLNLTGFCLRPGCGEGLDEWRIGQLWPLFEQGLQYLRESQNWSEWWTLWRRAAGGLDAERQQTVLAALAGPLQRGAMARASGIDKAAYDDVLRLAASLERVPVDSKVQLGEQLLTALGKPSAKALGWWALGRLGARQPLYGSSHAVVRVEVARGWLARVLALDWRQVEPAAFAACQLARYTGDRARDLPADLRESVAVRLAEIGASTQWVEMLRGLHRLEEADARRAYGEALPAGLRLLAD